MRIDPLPMFPTDRAAPSTLPEALRTALAIPARRGLPLLLAGLAACTSAPERPAPEEPAPCLRPVAEDAPTRALLAFYVANARAPAALPRERVPPRDPLALMQHAVQFGQARPADLPKALALLEAVMKSGHPNAANLAPLARLLYDQYGERLRLEVQLRDAQRRADQLQDKIEALSAIERSLPARGVTRTSAPASVPPAGTTPPSPPSATQESSR